MQHWQHATERARLIFFLGVDDGAVAHSAGTLKYMAQHCARGVGGAACDYSMHLEVVRSII